MLFFECVVAFAIACLNLLTFGFSDKLFESDTSLKIILLSGPVPFNFDKSIDFSFEIFLASGDIKTLIAPLSKFSFISRSSVCILLEIDFIFEMSMFFFELFF